LGAAHSSEFEIFLYDSFLLSVVPGPCYDTCGGAGNFITARSSEVLAALFIGWSFLLSVISAVRHLQPTFWHPRLAETNRKV
jgi:hypothetical protein